MNDRIDFPEPAIAFCPLHLKPFEKEWPKGYALLAISTLQRVFEHPRFSSKFPVNPATGLAELDKAKATQLLRTLSPLCCLLGRDVFKELTDLALAGKLPEKK
jgi:hypothetical protein